MRIYVAGPMTGLPEYNLPTFASTAQQITDSGHEAVNPGYRGVIAGYTWQDYMREGLALLLTCEAVALLDGWEASRGAQLEAHVARALDMPVRYWTDWVT